MKQKLTFLEIAQFANNFEDDYWLTFDDVLHKLTQELWEFNDAIQKYRWRYCKTKYETLDEVQDELWDVLFNLVSICHRLGIDITQLEKYPTNNLKKIEERKHLYEKNQTT